MLGEPTTREAVITSDVTTEWKTYHHLIVNKTESDMKFQLKELASNDMLKTMFPDLNKLAIIFYQFPLWQRQLKEAFLNEVDQELLTKQPEWKSLTYMYLMKITIGSPAELKESYLEEVVDI